MALQRPGFRLQNCRLLSAKDEFGRDLVEEDDGPRFKEMSRMMEMHFGKIARKILAGKRGKLALVHSTDQPPPTRPSLNHEAKKSCKTGCKTVGLEIG